MGAGSVISSATYRYVDGPFTTSSVKDAMVGMARIEEGTTHGGC